MFKVRIFGWAFCFSFQYALSYFLKVFLCLCLCLRQAYRPDIQILRVLEDCFHQIRDMICSHNFERSVLDKVGLESLESETYQNSFEAVPEALHGVWKLQQQARQFLVTP